MIHTLSNQSVCRMDGQFDYFDIEFIYSLCDSRNNLTSQCATEGQYEMRIDCVHDLGLIS